ncbi:protocatechuate 3,4-dioxygenase subunit beta [Aliidongia dinghuensis]|uniref:Protocatechuate 3,4-dioxygenase subunit beta n=1 Tax=Aliidongia dinghuensis TaxID=1867774 RepID=A0A8J2YR32_9PROT|nr:protocatechuate 3,4-dioxygenase subunit beta [Aliidongia dinghuensis]GGF06210.1 protocatechuate 3,4-dioxygenase subunit beta [Aliidongia dinghuensis]
MSTPDSFNPVPAGTHPAYASPEYKSTILRSPAQPLVRLPHTLTEVTGPQPGADVLGPTVADFTKYNGGEAVGERIIVTGRVLDDYGRPVPHTVLEIWQANAAGRYHHPVDQHAAPLDPHFLGSGRVTTDADGTYRFQSIKPGAYPWKNHHNAWRPNHIHFSLFGPGMATRLITQMYFPGDPLLALDPIYNSIPDAAARQRLVSHFDIEVTQPEYALGYRFDIVLRGRHATPMEN